MPTPKYQTRRRQSGAWFAGRRLMGLFIQVLVEITLKATVRMFREMERLD
jgi:hypothetical protein